MSIRPTVLKGKRAASTAGFTLIEVIAGMALMMTVIGGVYGIASGALGLGKSMASSRVHEARLMNFVSAWREYLESLPPNTRITVGEKPSRKFGRGSLLIENGSVPFAWSREVRLAPAVEFKVSRSKTDRNSSTLLVRHLRKPERATSPDDYEVIAELPLIEGLREFTWQFYDTEKKKWVTLWEDKSAPPLFMRLRLAFAHEPREKAYEYVFWFSGGNAINEAGAPRAPAIPGQTPPPGLPPMGQRIPVPQPGGMR